MILKSIFLFLLAILISGTLSVSFSQQSAKLKQLTVNADIIVTGKISRNKSNWNTEKTRIYSEATLYVDEYLKGQNSGNSVVIIYPGGEVNGVGELYTHMPKFADNEDVLVFLKKDEKGYKVFDGEEGKMKLVKDANTGERITTSNVRFEDLKTQIKKYLTK
jgi:hypothetical protein